MQLNRAWPSINQLTQPLLDNLRRDANVLRLKLETLSNGATIIDAGIDTQGGLEAGRRIAEICMGGLGHVTLNTCGEKWPFATRGHNRLRPDSRYRERRTPVGPADGETCTPGSTRTNSCGRYADTLPRARR